jgi:hypothetical protein
VTLPVANVAQEHINARPKRTKQGLYVNKTDPSTYKHPESPHRHRLARKSSFIVCEGAPSEPTAEEYRGSASNPVQATDSRAYHGGQGTCKVISIILYSELY